LLTRIKALLGNCTRIQKACCWNIHLPDNILAVMCIAETNKQKRSLYIALTNNTANLHLKETKLIEDHQVNFMRLLGPFNLPYDKSGIKQQRHLNYCVTVKGMKIRTMVKLISQITILCYFLPIQICSVINKLSKKTKFSATGQRMAQ